MEGAEKRSVVAKKEERRKDEVLILIIWERKRRGVSKAQQRDEYKTDRDGGVG